MSDYIPSSLSCCRLSHKGRRLLVLSILEHRVQLHCLIEPNLCLGHAAKPSFRLQLLFKLPVERVLLRRSESRHEVLPAEGDLRRIAHRRTIYHTIARHFILLQGLLEDAISHIHGFDKVESVGKEQTQELRAGLLVQTWIVESESAL